jgi:hypothetical protein
MRQDRLAAAEGKSYGSMAKPFILLHVSVEDEEGGQRGFLLADDGISQGTQPFMLNELSNIGILQAEHFLTRPLASTKSFCLSALALIGWRVEL